jgi:hypothetical protein
VFLEKRQKDNGNRLLRRGHFDFSGLIRRMLAKKLAAESAGSC